MPLSAGGPDLADLEGVIGEAESIKYSTPLFERMKASFIRLRDALQALDAGLVNGKAAKRGKEFIRDDSVAYKSLESALLQVRSCLRSRVFPCYPSTVCLKSALSVLNQHCLSCFAGSGAE